MSQGVNLLAALAARVAEALGPEFDIEILEMHHRHKRDAPSGTSLLLGRAMADARGVSLEERGVRTRDGDVGPRREGDIGFAALRGGDMVGEHRVIFAGPGERIELAHIATDRVIFARGAVKAALWARGRAPGLYAMTDVLGL
jgi:4-hydroxy-tetrahydrodipicolinate reductase